MSDTLTGPALEEALAARGLPSEGNADDKRAAVAKFDAEQRAEAPVDLGQHSDTTDGDTASVRFADAHAAARAKWPTPTPRDTSNDRFEEYDTSGADESLVYRMLRNMETGETIVLNTRPVGSEVEA